MTELPVTSFCVIPEGGAGEISSVYRSTGEPGVVKKLHGIRLEWEKDANGRPTKFKEVAGSEFELDCDLCLLAMGFTGPERPGAIERPADLPPAGPNAVLATAREGYRKTDVNPGELIDALLMHSLGEPRTDDRRLGPGRRPWRAGVAHDGRRREAVAADRICQTRIGRHCYMQR